MAITTGSSEAPLRGSSGQIFDLEPPQAQRKSRIPELALGILLIVGGALGALVWQLSTNRTTPVLAVATPIAHGDVVELDDLELIEIRAVEQINVLGAERVGDVVGRVARTDLAPGTLVTPEHVTDGSTIELGNGVVGLALIAGEYPSSRLRPGDVVNVILTPEPGAVLEPRVGGASGAAEQTLVREAVVAEVAPTSNQDGLFVALEMSEADAAVTASAAAQDRVRLVEVPGGSG